MRTPTRLGCLFTTLVFILLLLMAACASDDKESPVDKIESTEKATQEPELTDEVVITIGNLSDLTGAGANAMEIINMALDDVVTYYNQTILPPGVTIKVETYDGQYDSSKNIPGYEWLKEKGADLIFTPMPAAPRILKSRVDRDEVVLFAIAADKEGILPPGYVFNLGTVPENNGYTFLKWIAENDWDYQTDGPAKIGGACWIGSALEKAQEAMRDYAEAHPDQFEWVGSFAANHTFIWGPEVAALKDCDYVATPTVWPSFVKEYRNAGYTAKFIGDDSHMAFLRLIDDANLWDEIDKTLVVRVTRWWNEEGTIIDLTTDLLKKNHPSSVEDIKQAGSGYMAMHQLNQMLEIIAEAIETTGPENFSSQALYEAAKSYSQIVDGTQHGSFSETKRDVVDAYAIYEVRAANKDIFRMHDDWLPTMREP